MNKIIITGMPNSGKSTVFNGLTNGNAHVGNWHGVTVDVLSKIAKIGGKEYLISDLPGAYSLTPSTLEEKKALEFIKSSDGIILFIIEAVTFSLAIKSAIQYIRQGRQVIIAINMVKELTARGGNINFNKLSKLLPCDVIYGEFNTKKGIELIKKAIANCKLREKIDGNALFNFNANSVFTPPFYKESFLDKITLSPIFAFPCFILLTLFIFYISFGKFGLGQYLSNEFSDFFTKFQSDTFSFLQSVKISPFISNLICDGIIGGLLGVVCFLPQMLIISLSLTVCEQSGYMARLAYVSEGALKNTGLNGRAIFSVFMGFGCTAMSVISTGGLENIQTRKRAVLTASTVPCSAKIPVLTYLSTYSKYPFLFMVGIYAVGVVFSLTQLYLSGKLFVKGDRQPLVIELPPYRKPKIAMLLKSLLSDAKQFIIKICTVIFIISVALFLLKSVTPNLSYAGENFNQSILFSVGKALSFLTIPIGVYDARISACVLAGFFAKEGILSALITLFPQGIPFSFASLFALSVFIYAYTPCVTAMYTVSAQISKKFSVKLGILQLIEALLISYTAYCFIKYTVPSVLILIFIITAFTLYKFIKRKNR